MGCTNSNIDLDSKFEEEMEKEKPQIKRKIKYSKHNLEKIENDLKKDFKTLNKEYFYEPPKIISEKEGKNILFQMQNSICKIKLNNGKKGRGFFCKIPVSNNHDLLPVLITNNSILGEKSIVPGKKIKIIISPKNRTKEITIDDFRETFTSEKDDITIIELKEKDKLNENSFLEIDNDAYKDNIDEINLIYLLDYQNNKNLEYSTGIFKSIDKDNYIMEQSISTDISCSGCPIINSMNLKVVGIQSLDENKGKNIGLYIKEPLKKFKDKYIFNKNMLKIKNIKENCDFKLKPKEFFESPRINNNNRYEEKNKISHNDKKLIKQIYENSISIKYKINDLEKILIFGKIFVKNNKKICKIYIDGDEKELSEYYYNESKEDEIEIKLLGINNIIDSSYMFSGCENLISISDLSKWKTSNVINMKYMFSGCKLLKYITDISEWDISNVSDLSYMFYNCESLKFISNISKWNISKVNNMNSMFYGCKLLTSIPDISNWSTSNVINMNSIFYGCKSLRYLPEISKWNTSNVINMSSIFYGCISLFSLPDISIWNISKVTNLSYMFSKCEKLLYLPDISKWDISNVINLSSIFSECESLSSLPDISNWNISNVTDLSYMFCKCKSLEFIPDISNWDTSKVINLNNLFFNCTSLETLPDISKWNTSKTTNMSYIFCNCKLLSSLPDISNWNTSNVINMSYLFSNCKSLLNLPDISKWDTSKVFDMSFIFDGCKLLSFLPDISKWNTSNVSDMKLMFNECKSLLYLPDISKWDTSNVTDMRYIFNECINLSYLPDISMWNIEKVKNMSKIIKSSCVVGCYTIINSGNINCLNLSDYFNEIKVLKLA